MRLFVRWIFSFGLALACTTSAASYGAESYVQSFKPFKAEIGRLCPQKHLENLNPGFLDEIIEDYLGQLSPREQKQMERAAQPICVGSLAGISCLNIAYIRAARKLGTTRKLAQAACKSDWVCRVPFECTKSGD